jgi:hypothetical protein
VEALELKEVPAGISEDGKPTLVGHAKRVLPEG